MSNCIMNTITISCIFLGSSSVAIANQKPLTVENIAKEYQSYIVDYKGYPDARRSEVTEHILESLEKSEKLEKLEKSENIEVESKASVPVSVPKKTEVEKQKKSID